MSNQQNYDKAKTFLDAICEHDRAKMAKVCHPDFLWTLVPKSLGAEPLAGDAAIDRLSSIGNTVFKSGSMSSTITRSVEDSNSVIFEANVKGTTATEKQYDNWYVLWFEFKDGLISAFIEHTDTKYAIDVLRS